MSGHPLGGAKTFNILLHGRVSLFLFLVMGVTAETRQVVRKHLFSHVGFSLKRNLVLNASISIILLFVRAASAHLNDYLAFLIFKHNLINIRSQISHETIYLRFYCVPLHILIFLAFL